MKRMMWFALKGLLFFALIWGGVIAYWEYTRRQVSSEDLILYLVLLPLAILLVWWLAKRVWRLGRRLLIGSPVVASANADMLDAQAGGNPSAASPEPPQAHFVLATSIASPLGGASDWLDKVNDFQIHHQLDQALSDSVGFGIRSARIHEIEVNTEQPGTRIAMLRIEQLLHKLQEDLAPTIRAIGKLVSDPTRAEVRRIDAVHLHPEWLGQASSNTNQQAVSQKQFAIKDLQALLLLPADVSVPEASLLQHEVAHWAKEQGWAASSVLVTTVVAQQPFDGARGLHDWWQRHSQSGQSLMLILSAVSWLDETVLMQRLAIDAEWAARLQKASTIVGEAAAGLVLSKHLPVEMESGETMPSLAKIAGLTYAERSKPIDVRGSIEADLLAELLTTQCAAWNINEQTCVGVVVTGDQWHGRPIELGRWLTDQLPTLELGKDIVHIGTHLGECVPVADILGLALAVEKVQEAQQPVVFCSNHDKQWRAMSVVMPVTKVA